MLFSFYFPKLRQRNNVIGQLQCLSWTNVIINTNTEISDRLRGEASGEYLNAPLMWFADVTDFAFKSTLYILIQV